MKLDRAVLAFLRTEALHPADFTIRVDGGEAQSGAGKAGSEVDDVAYAVPAFIKTWIWVR